MEEMRRPGEWTRGELEDALNRALAYPYPIPSRSYVLAAGEALAPDAVQVDLSARTALLAYGSNAAPEVLTRKLGTGTDPLPAVRVALSGFDAVYSAHISAYGAVPATVHPSPGTEVTAFVVYLTAAQLQRMSETEPNYELRELGGVSAAASEVEVPDEVPAYVSRHGPLSLDGGEVALAGVRARGRRFPAASQEELLERVREALAPELSLEEFVAAVLSDPQLARRWNGRLRDGRTLARR